MRIDKYLKVARILKRRVVAKELAENERLFINNRLAKASSEIKPGDVIKIIYGHKTIIFKVSETREQASKQDALGMYEIEDEYTNENDIMEIHEKI